MRHVVKIGLALVAGSLWACECGDPVLDDPDQGGRAHDAARGDTTPDLVVGDRGVVSDLRAIDRGRPDVVEDRAPGDLHRPDRTPTDRTVATRQVIARWDFEDEDDVVDEGYGANRVNTLTSDGDRAFDGFTTGFESDHAAIFNALAQLNQSHVEVPVDCRGFVQVQLSYAARCSATAARYWKLQSAIAGGAWNDVGSVIEQPANVWLGAVEFHVAGADLEGDVRLRLVATDSAGDGSGDWLRVEGSGPPASSGSLRIDDVTITGVLVQPYDAGPVDRVPETPDSAVDRVTVDLATADDVSLPDRSAPDIASADTATPDTATPDTATPDAGRPDRRPADRPGRPDRRPADRPGRPDIVFSWDGFQLPDGFSLPDIDLLNEYHGEHEDGVICGGATCDPQIACCVGIGLTCDVEGDGCSFGVPVPCDGPEDCPGFGQICCFNTSTYRVTCEGALTCVTEGTFVCANSGDCLPGFACCSADLLSTFGLEGGLCIPGGCD